jgi:O-antigen/teichoic acid export membrane protein
MDSPTAASSPTTASTEVAVRTRWSATKRQIRGSSLLLVGQFLSKGVNFAVQVLIVRYLAKSDYGAFAYALSIVSVGQTIALFGLDRAITRFVPIYHEQHDYDKMFGTIFMVLGTVISLGIALVLVFYGLQGFITAYFISDQLAFSLLLILIFLSPINALDTMLNGMFAVFSRPGAIFFRKYVMGPGLRLSIVLLLTLSNRGVRFLSIGYLGAGALAVLIYAIILLHALKEQGIFRYLNLRSIQIPAREVLYFTVPLLASDLVYVVMNSVDAVLLERFQGVVDVAALRAVQPTARLNQMVLSSFGLLFTPAAARMFARNDKEGVNDLYWQNAIWIAVVSFPIFIVTFSFAKPITLFLYGARYEQSALILALLSLGYYFNAALGQNGLTLKVFGKVKYIVAIDVFVAILNLGVNLVLIPRLGAVGAAIGTFSILVIFNILKQAGLRFGTGINIFDWRYLRGYLIIAFCAIGLLVIQVLTSAPLYISILLAGMASLLVLILNRQLLNVEQTFPELLKFPFIRYLLGKQEHND